MRARPGAGDAVLRGSAAIGRLTFPYAVAARRRLRLFYLRDLTALVIAYYAAAHLGYAFEFSGPVAAIVWLPVGVGIAFLYLRGLDLWPGVVLGDLLVNNYATLPLGSALAQSLGNVSEVVVATILLRRFCRRDMPLATLRDVGGVLGAIAAGTLVSATIGSVASWLGEVIPAHSLPYVLRTWWLGDLCGALIVLPLALAWARPPAPRWRVSRILEASLTIGAVAGLSVLAALDGGMTDAIVFPALIWAAVRFGPQGATLAITTSAACAIWMTTHHQLGPFGIGSIDIRLLNTQLFIAIVSVSALSIAALVAERTRLAENVRASRARLVAASDEVRRRLERDLHDGAQHRLVVLSARLTRAAEEAHEHHERSAPMLDAVEADLVKAINELREFSRGVHPAVLRDLGLTAALRAVASHSTIPVKLVEAAPARLDETSEATAYYVALEAITNAEKYSRGSAVEVRAKLRAGWLSLEIADDGIGGAIEREGSGLEGLRDRVEATCGSLRIRSEPGHGTCIVARLPVTVISD
jgi:signal transduction histidine kinase